MKLTDRISDKHRMEQVVLHAAPRGYGGKGRRWADMVRGLAAGHDVTTVLDYGAGQGSLAYALEGGPLQVTSYDPAVLSFTEEPAGEFDLVVCTDVLEHVEEDKLAAVLAHIRSLAAGKVFLSIGLKASNKTLSDGRDAHVLLMSRQGWLAALEAADFTLEAEWPDEDGKHLTGLFQTGGA